MNLLNLIKKFKNEATKDFITGLNNVRQFDTSFNSISQLTLRKKVETHKFNISNKVNLNITLSIGVSTKRQ